MGLLWFYWKVEMDDPIQKLKVCEWVNGDESSGPLNHWMSERNLSTACTRLIEGLLKISPLLPTNGHQKQLNKR